MKNFVLICLLLVGYSYTGFAQKLNPSSISTNGAVYTIVQDSTKIYIGGSFSTAGYKATGIAKLNGNARSAYDFPSLNGSCYASVPDGNGGWYLGGSFTINGRSNLVHVLPDNTLDPAFSPNPNSSVNALYLDNNRLFVGGYFTQIGGQTQNYLAALDAATGSLQSWNPNPNGNITAITQSGNTVYIGGGFTAIGGKSNRYFAAIDALTDSLIPQVSVSSTVKAMAQDANNLYLGGNFSGANGFFTGSTALLNTSSDLPDFDLLSLSGQMYASVPDGNGGWYLGGSFSNQGINNLLHLLPNQTIDPAFAPNPNSAVYALYRDGNTLYIGGSFTQVGGQSQNNLAAYDLSSATLKAWAPNPNAVVYAIEKNASTVFVGGSFTTIGGKSNRYFAAIDESSGAVIPFISASATVNALTQDANNLYLGGSFSGVSGYYTGALTQFSSGADLPSFDFPVLNGQVYQSIADGSGGWYVGGSFNIQGISNLVHVLPNQTIDPAFAPNPNAAVTALSLDGSTLYAGGSFTQISSTTRNYLAAVDAGTGAILSWNPNPNSSITSLLKEGNAIYVGGNFTTIGGKANRYVASIDATTGVVNPFTSASSTVNVMVQDATTLYLGGNFSSANGYYTGISTQFTTSSDLPDFNFPVLNGQIYRSLPDGNGGWYVGGSFSIQGISNLVHILANNTIDPGFAPNPNSNINALYLDGSTLYVGGSFSQINSQSQSYLAALNASTGALQTWNPAPNGGINAIAKVGNTVYAGGSFSSIGGQSRNYLAALDATSALATAWNPNPNSTVNSLKVSGSDIIASGFFSIIGGQSRFSLAALSQSTGNATAWNPAANGYVETLELNGTNLYVGGSFSSIGGQPRTNLAEISLSTGLATAWVPNPNATVRTLKLVGSTVYVGGDFATIGGQTRNYLAAVNNTTGSALSWNPAPSGSVYSLNVHGTTIFAGGNFQFTKAVSRNYVLAIAKASGQINSFNPGPNSYVNALALNGTSLYVGGSFSSIGGQPRNYLAEINTGTGNASTWNPNANSLVRNIQLLGTTIYAGGDFTTIGGQSRNYLAALNNTNGNALSWDPGPNASIYALSLSGSTLLAGGSFQYTKAASRNYLMAIGKSNGLITSWNPALNSPIQDLQLNSPNLYIGGSFTSAGGQPRNYLAEISLSTGNATVWNPNANGTVRNLALIGATVYVGGDFTTIGGQNRAYLAALNTSTGNALSWDPRPNSSVYTLGVNGNDLLAGGAFQYLKSENRNYLLSINKATGQIGPWNPLSNGTVETIVVKAGGTTAYIGGAFSNTGGQPRNNIAEISLSTGLATTWNPNANGTVRGMAQIGTTVYAGGDFSLMGGQARNYLAAVQNSSGAVLPWNPQPNGTVYQLTPFNNEVMAAGTFQFMNAEQRSSLLAISKATGLITPWNPAPNGPVYTLEPRGTNAYVGGSFSTVGGQPRNRAAEISLLTGGATTWNPDVNATVYSIKRHGNTVYLAGDFTSVSGQSRTYVAAVNAANGSPASWSPVLNAGVRKLALTDSLLFIGGSFTSISGTTRNRLASFVMANGLMTDWNPDVNGTVNDLQLLGSSLYIGGYFTEVAGQSRGSAASFALENGALKSWNPKITGSVAALTGKGNYLYLGGGFNEAGGQTSHGFAAIHTRTGIPELFFPNVQGSLYTVSAFDSLVYFGGSFSTVDGINFGGLASASYPFGSFKPRLDDYTPKSGGNTGSVTLVINGNTFGKGAEVTLRRNGQPDIPLREMYLADGSQISGTLDLRGAAPGKWDLIIKLEADSVFSLMDGFTIEPGTAPQPWSTVMGFDQIRTNRWQSYNLVYGNSGNTDAKGVPVWFTVSNNAQLDLKYPVSRTSQYFNIAQDDLYDSLTSFIVIDTVLDIIGPAKLVGVYLPTIPANSSNALTFKVKLTAPGTIRMISWADEPYFADSVRSWVPECYETLYDKGLSVNPANNCLNESLNQGYSVGSKSLQQVLNGNIGAGAGSLVFSMPAIMASGLKECVPGLGNPQIQSSTTEITKLLSESYVNRLKGGRNADSISSCLPPTSAPAQLPGIQTVSSFDPNDKVGPVGVGNEHFFKVNQVFPYIIRCENISTATAPAQTVIILDTLDQALLDLASFQLGFLSIADSIIPVPRGLQHYETDIDLRPANNIIAHVKADLDLLTGIARWEFTSLDPATLEETEDPLAGFLPPNLSNAEGEASVMFTINAKGPVANGTQFKNRASIYFDSNAPILTPRWINTNDVQSPVSQVKPLPAVQFKDSIELHLQGEDLLSGLRSYALYYAVNGGIFSLLEPYLTDTTYLFKGEFGSDYAFFSIATDSLGNVEAMKNTAEASTSFAVGVETPAALSVTVYPNPNNGQFELAVRPQSSGTYTLTLTDLMGRSLQEEELWLNSGENLIPLTMEQSGIYFLTLGNQHTKTVKRVVVNK